MPRANDPKNIPAAEGPLCESGRHANVRFRQWANGENWSISARQNARLTKQLPTCVDRLTTTLHRPGLDPYALPSYLPLCHIRKISDDQIDFAIA